MKVSIIRKGEYDIWSMRMRQYICHTDHNLWDVLSMRELVEAHCTNWRNICSPAPTMQTTGYINQKFLRSLPPSWNQIALIMRNKPDIDEIDIDDLYNNLRVYEDEMKRSSSSTSTSQNLAFLSFENTSTAGRISQIDEDDLEELDLRWQVAMLTVRCYNCHRKGHFARECRSGRNQGKRSYGDNGRSNAPTNESSSQALVAQDGLGGYDWSNDFEIEPVNYALMAISSSSSSSSSNNEISLSVFYVRSSDEESTPANDRSSKADGYHVVPPPITGNFLTPRADISFIGLDEYAIRKKIIESKTTDLNTKTSETVGSSNTDVLDLHACAVLITGYVSKGTHVDTSLIHIESRKSPTKSLFDAGSSRISIFIVSTYVSLGCSGMITRIMLRTLVNSL
ncbi:ribonuclease H-like domain-containing protein [Tanacetum coccineum]